MKVALIAMSGVRIYNDELMKIGMTLPGFVERSRVVASMPSLALLTLAALTPDSFEVSYHEVEGVDGLAELPDCDVAAFSTFTARAKDAYSLSARFRARGTPTVIGGLHATVLPDEAALHFDAVVVGEGEPVWRQLLADLRQGHLQPRYRADQEFDLADAPIPRFDLLDIHRYNRLPVQTQRGCPWRCEFCASSIRLTPLYKTKPAERVVDEVRYVKSLWPKPFIEFADDNTFVGKEHGRSLMRACARERFRWFTESDISVADDDEVLRLMHEAGCAQVLVGLESPTAAALDGLERRRDWKRRRFDRYIESVQRIQSHGIAVNGCFVLGLDGHDQDVFEAVAEFVERSGIFEVQITVQTPFPGTPLYERLREEGRLLREGAWELCTLFDVNFRPAQMSAADLQAGLVELGRTLYTTEARQRRANAFRHQAHNGSRHEEAVHNAPAPQ